MTKDTEHCGDAQVRVVKALPKHSDLNDDIEFVVFEFLENLFVSWTVHICMNVFRSHVAFAVRLDDLDAVVLV